MLALGVNDVEEIAIALADQTDYEHRWLLDPRTGQVAFWTSDTGVDGVNPVEITELDLIPIVPIPSNVWYQEMTDFAEGISYGPAGQRPARASGSGSVPSVHKPVPRALSPADLEWARDAGRPGSMPRR